MVVETPLERSTGATAGEFNAKLDDVRSLVIVLKAISFKAKANCVITGDGIRFIIEDCKALQARAYMQHVHFRDFHFSATPSNIEDDTGATNEIMFAVDIQILLECLTIFAGASSSIPAADHLSRKHMGGQRAASQIQDSQPGFGVEQNHVALRISYPPQANVLSLMLEERGVVTTCDLMTYDPEPLVELHTTFVAHRTIIKVIMKSDWLKDAFSELDGTCDTVGLFVSPQPPYFRLSASGLAGDAQMDYPKDTDVIESFQCIATASHNYKYNLLQSCLKALSVSTKTSIRVNEVGFLSMQFMIVLNEQDVTFVEYLISPKDADTDEDEV